MTNARSITNSVRKALKEAGLLEGTTTRTQEDFRNVPVDGVVTQVRVFRTVIEFRDYTPEVRTVLADAGFDVAISNSDLVVVYTPRPSDEPARQEVAPVEQPRVIEDFVVEGDWYLVPAEGDRLTDRHAFLGPYTTQDMAEHLRTTYAAEGIAGVVVQSVTTPVLARREIEVGDTVYQLDGAAAEVTEIVGETVFVRTADGEAWEHEAEELTKQAPEPEVTLSELHMRRKFSRVHRVVGTELGGVRLQAVNRSGNPIIRYGHELIEDGWVACEADGSLPTRDVHDRIFVAAHANLRELVFTRQACSRLFVSEFGELFEEGDYVSAKCTIDAIDAELLYRHETGLRASLIDLARCEEVTARHKRNGTPVPQHVRQEQAELCVGIGTHLRLFGHLVRD